MTEPLQRLFARLRDEDRLITAFLRRADSALPAAVAHDVLVSTPWQLPQSQLACQIVSGRRRGS